MASRSGNSNQETSIREEQFVMTKCDIRLQLKPRIGTRVSGHEQFVIRFSYLFYVELAEYKYKVLLCFCL